MNASAAGAAGATSATSATSERQCGRCRRCRRCGELSGDRIADPQCGGALVAGCRATLERLDATAYYADYHPASHYWPLQLTATAIVLAVAAAAALAAFRLVRRRTG
ncbi:hypothetical protein [Streptomyces blattellae]|uniref:hypothetical protein n=1 Tax=Streptomyces blattellae TaxID=2569855 RepID=UPI0012B79DDF|nr:hypothetical protein [Streptomyces blattellae]